MKGRTVAIAAALAACAAIPLRAHGQQLRGVVRDSASRLVIPAAVVTLLDSSGSVVARTITTERGQFRVMLLRDAVPRLRIVRLGFRPTEVMVPAARDGAIDLDVAMAAIPFSLQSVQVTGNANCPRRRDRAAAVALLEQARAGLLASIVARSEKPARMMRLRAVREMDGSSSRVVRQSVRIDSGGTTFGSFGAARSAPDFVNEGFTADSAGLALYYGPDAEVLLDDRFSSLYCFHVMDRDRARPNQVGLGFRPAAHRDGRVDVDGALWIDTVARVLVDIEYRYLNLDERTRRFQPGGRISFHAMPNGVVVIDRWQIRMVSAPDDAGDVLVSPVRRATADGITPDPNLHPIEVWGELARAEWPDGVRWSGSLGTLRLRVVSADGAPARGVVVRLADTDYRGTSDSTGTLEIPHLVPGPYAVEILDPELARFGIAVATPLRFEAARDSVVETQLVVKGLGDYVTDRCVRDGQRAERQGPGASWLIGVVTTPDAQPIADARWTLTVHLVKSATTRGASPSVRNGEVGPDGTFHYCGLQRGEEVEIVVRRAGYMDERVALTMTRPVMVVPIQMKVRRR